MVEMAGKFKLVKNGIDVEGQNLIGRRKNCQQKSGRNLQIQ
jgi:hypothetical protein